LIRETTENESANEGYRFGQEEETYNIVAAHGYFVFISNTKTNPLERELTKHTSNSHCLKDEDNGFLRFVSHSLRGGSVSLFTPIYRRSPP
jgi:hypothetical protein